MLRLEFYPMMHGVQVRAVGIDKQPDPNGVRPEPVVVQGIIGHSDITNLGLPGAVAKWLWATNDAYPALVGYARR